jgi:23S rRNA pseudouridine955/2504/2580 synthase
MPKAGIRLYTGSMPIARDRILYQDDQFLVVNKLSRELVVAGKGKMEKLPLLDFLKKDHPGIQTVHRLDFETSGIVVFAKNRAILSSIIDTNFAGWEKQYQAIVAGGLSGKGEIDKPLPSRETKENIPAKTLYRVIKAYKGASHVEATIVSGKHHQIRRHFAMIHHPLILDEEYGDGKVNREMHKKLRYHHFFLHASAVTFPHPITKEVIHIEAPLPGSFIAALKKLQVTGSK